MGVRVLFEDKNWYAAGISGCHEKEQGRVGGTKSWAIDLIYDADGVEELGAAYPDKDGLIVLVDDGERRSLKRFVRPQTNSSVYQGACATCPTELLRCCAQQAPSCEKQHGWNIECTTWHHISDAEHYCGDCHRLFKAKHLCSARDMDVYVAGKYLPIWVRCTNSFCCKWRVIFPTALVSCILLEPMHSDPCNDNDVFQGARNSVAREETGLHQLRTWTCSHWATTITNEREGMPGGACSIPESFIPVPVSSCTQSPVHAWPDSSALNLDISSTGLKNICHVTNSIVPSYFKQSMAAEEVLAVVEMTANDTLDFLYLTADECEEFSALLQHQPLPCRVAGAGEAEAMVPAALRVFLPPVGIRMCVKFDDGTVYSGVVVANGGTKVLIQYDADGVEEWETFPDESIWLEEDQDSEDEPEEASSSEDSIENEEGEQTSDEEGFSGVEKKQPFLAARIIVNLRNLILTLWHQRHNRSLFAKNDVEQYELSIAEVVANLHVPGLVRACYIDLLPKVFSFLFRKGCININAGSPGTPKQTRAKIAVIGAGIAGLAAAQHLKCMGYEVVVLEAGHRVGGRIHDVISKQQCSCKNRCNCSATYESDTTGQPSAGGPGNRQLNCSLVAEN
jgi:hypothetical protein